MKAVILAGGYARRFWPVTLHKPKPLLPIAGKPILDFLMEKLEQVPEIDTIYISTNAVFEEIFSEWMKKRKSSKRVELVVEPTVKEEHKLGSIGAMEYLIKNKKITSDLMLLAGDNLFSFDLAKFAQSYQEDPRIILYKMNNRARCSRYGVVDIDEAQKVTDFEEKPTEPKTSLVSTACYVFPRKTLPLVKQYLAGKHPVDNMGSFLEWLYHKVTVRGVVMEGYWYDIGDKHFYIQANIKAMSKHKDNILFRGKKNHARISRSYVGEGSMIKNSAIKDCVIFDNVHIENCVLRECIVDDNARLVNVDLNDSLVGSHTRLNKQKIFKTRRFFLPPVTGQEILKPD
ncbi:NDP-sugar synthase [archaeon]|nr:NDP-sugar synthase [archaeon]